MSIDGDAKRVIDRLLLRKGLHVDEAPDVERWNGFVGALNTVISDLTRDRYLLERSLDMTVQDMVVLHANLERALAKLRDEQETLARGWHRQRALAELGRRAIEGAAVPEMLRAAVALATSAMHAPVATVFQLRDGALLQRRADVGWESFDSAELIPISPDSQAQFVIAEPEGTVVVSDYANETRFTPASLLTSKGVRSSVSARIGSAADPFGIVSVHSYEAGHFGSDDDIFISELAHVLTLAIDRDRHADWLAHKAFHDDLTGLPNRSLLRERLEHALERSRRSAASVTLLLFDLDGFKMINDSRGHAAGDLLLVDVAERLERNVREGDTPARIGGDEFAVLVDDADPAATRVLASRLLEVLRAPFKTADGDVMVRASVGIADNGNGLIDADELLVRADLAMYAAKGRGGDQFQTFTADMQEELHRRHKLHADLQQALVHDEFCLHYQPIIELATGRVESFEALVRWNHPTLGMVGPNDFIRLADETNLIGPIGRFVMKEACRQLAAWRNLGLIGDDVPVGVNVSARQFFDPDFCTDVQRALTAAKLPATNLILELTESSLLADTAFIQYRLQRLRDLGVRIAVDDFGTGYSSLAYLRAFPVDYLKIDKAFVDELSNHKGDGEVMIRSIIGLGHNLNLRVVAEGIEEPEQLRKLEFAGCDFGQGYLFARPLAPEGVPSFLIDHLGSLR